MTSDGIAKAAEAVAGAKNLVIVSGAGMSVDSGLPDFRSEQGLWRHPAYARQGVSALMLSNPRHFQRKLGLGWGFFEMRRQAYDDAEPHRGYRILQEIAQRYSLNIFSVTSNIDGHFRRSGYPKHSLFEPHGSIHWRQCLKPCSNEVWPMEGVVAVDRTTLEASPIPQCPFCQGPARPNVYMFGDLWFVKARAEAQSREWEAYLERCRGEASVVLEFGAGNTIDTMRQLAEWLGSEYRMQVVRVNPNEPEIPAPHTAIRAGALEMLTCLESILLR